MEAALFRNLREQSGKIDPSHARAVPSSFDPNDPELFAVVRPLSASWDSCERALRSSGARTVLVRIPLFWQIESVLHRVCKAVNVTICINEEANMPIGARAIATAGADIVLTTGEDAQLFARYLIDAQKPLPGAWHIIHRADMQWDMPLALKDSPARISQEVHLAPGIPLLVQCEALSERKEQHYHSSDLFRCDIGEDTRVTSVPNDPLSIEGMELPLRLRELSICACGKMTVERV